MTVCSIVGCGLWPWCSVVGSIVGCSHLISDIASVLRKEFRDIQVTIECRLTLKRVRDMIVKCTVQISSDNRDQSFGQFG